MELAHQFSRPHGPDRNSQVARTLEVGRATRSWPSKQAVKDTQVAGATEKWHEVDDTLGHRKLAPLLPMRPNRVRRVMHTSGITARLKRKKSLSRQSEPGDARSGP